MEIKKFRVGQWIILEGDTPAYFIYRLHKGTVSYFENGSKIRSVEVKDGMKPIFLGFTSALRDDRMHSASIKAETDMELEAFAVDTIRGALKHDVPDEMKPDIEQMIQVIVMENHIKSLKRRARDIPVIPEERMQVPNDVSPEVGELLSEVIDVYKHNVPHVSIDE
jgi:CRP-like cAMP-binding protein